MVLLIHDFMDGCGDKNASHKACPNTASQTGRNPGGGTDSCYQDPAGDAPPASARAVRDRGLRVVRGGGLRVVRGGGLRVVRDGGLRVVRDGGLRVVRGGGKYLDRL
jgi:hypothetical protein